MLAYNGSLRAACKYLKIYEAPIFVEFVYKFFTER